MIFVYNHSDYKQFLQDVADRFAGTFDGVTMHFHENVANGFIKLIELPGGLQAVLSDYVLNTDFIFFKTAVLPEIFNFRVDYVEQSDGAQIKMGDDEFVISSNIYTNVLIFSSRFNAKATLKKGSRLRGLGVIMKQDWLHKYFPQKLLSFWLNHTHILRSNNVNIIPLDFDARESFFDLLQLDSTKPTFLLNAQTRLLELLEYYFEKVASQKQLYKNSDSIMEDIGRLTDLDIFFTEQILKTGIVPSLSEMEKHAGMSATKLKTIFKKVYGQSIGEYFNSCRLNMASNMLLKDKLDIKVVSATLGYNSVPHFTTAFKKQFGRPPAALFKKS
jgi:AraC-like DNA-binding protein